MVKPAYPKKKFERKSSQAPVAAGKNTIAKIYTLALRSPTHAMQATPPAPLDRAWRSTRAQRLPRPPCTGPAHLAMRVCTGRRPAPSDSYGGPPASTASHDAPARFCARIVSRVRPARSRRGLPQPCAQAPVSLPLKHRSRGPSRGLHLTKALMAVAQEKERQKKSKSYTSEKHSFRNLTLAYGLISIRLALS